MIGTTNITVGTTSVQVIGSNPRHKYTLLTNENGIGEIYLAIGTNAVRGGGIPLISKGSSYEITKDNFLSVNITAIGTAGPHNLAILTY